MSLAHDVESRLLDAVGDAGPEVVVALLGELHGECAAVRRWTDLRPAAGDRCFCLPVDQLIAIDEQDGDRIVGLFHSHGREPPVPSPTDLATMALTPWPWLIGGVAEGVMSIRGFAAAAGGCRQVTVGHHDARRRQGPMDRA